MLELDIATDRLGFLDFNGEPRQHGVECQSEISLCGFEPSITVVREPVVDPPEIDQFLFRIEHGSFGGDGGSGLFHQFETGIENAFRFQGVFVTMVRNVFAGE